MHRNQSSFIVDRSIDGEYYWADESRRGHASSVIAKDASLGGHWSGCATLNIVTYLRRALYLLK